MAHAVACSSGTAGLHACFHALGLGPGDEVILPSFSFVASANAILYTGATPVFVEVDPLTFNLDPAAVEAAITPRTRAIEIVDIFGYPAEIPTLLQIARRAGLHVVEDACQAIGGSFDGRPLGGFGHPTVLAFYANKQMTTRRGRHRAHRRRATGPDTPEPRQPGAFRRRGVAGALPARVQLPPLRRARGDRRRAARAARRHARRTGPRRRLVPGAHRRDRRDTPMFEGPQGRSWFVYAPRLDPDVDRNRVIGELESAGHPGQAVSSVHPPAAVLPGGSRLPAGPSAGHRVHQRLDDRAAVLPRDDRGAGGPGVRRARVRAIARQRVRVA